MEEGFREIAEFAMYNEPASAQFKSSDLLGNSLTGAQLGEDAANHSSSNRALSSASLDENYFTIEENLAQSEESSPQGSGKGHASNDEGKWQVGLSEEQMKTDNFNPNEKAVVPHRDSGLVQELQMQHLKVENEELKEQLA